MERSKSGSYVKNISEYSKQTISPTQVIIQSLKHPTVPPRQCHKTTSSDNFRCYSCESSLTREEECEMMRVMTGLILT